MPNIISLTKNNNCPKRFCELIGDEKKTLLSNIIYHEHKAVLLLPVEDSETDDIKMLFVSFNKVKLCITDISFINCKDVVSVSNNIRSKLGNGNYMQQAQDACKAKCVHYFEHNILYYASEKGDLRYKVADFNAYAVDKLSSLFAKAKECNMELKEMIINGSEYIAIEKEFVDKHFGDGKRTIYRSLSACGIIYARREGAKKRYSHIVKKKDEKAVEYFAVSLEMFNSLIKGRYENV